LAPQDELIGGRLCDLFPVNVNNGLFERYKQIVLTGESFVAEVSLQDDNIKTAWLRIQAVKLGDGIAITASDIGDRKRQEDALRINNEMLDRTEQLTNDVLISKGICSSKQPGTVLWIPRACFETVMSGPNDAQLAAAEGAHNCWQTGLCDCSASP
jgi:hypothetical protein